jgi:hypothetical protein
MDKWYCLLLLPRSLRLKKLLFKYLTLVSNIIYYLEHKIVDIFYALGNKPLYHKLIQSF